MKKKKVKEKSIMEQLRDIREKLSDELQGMTPEQVSEFINNHATFHSKAFWDKPQALKK